MWRLLNLILPATCPSCDNVADTLVESPFCRTCWEKLASQRPLQRCPVCGMALPDDYSFTCISCLGDRPSFDRTFVFDDYEGLIKTAVHVMKFEKRKRLARPLGDLLTSIALPKAEAVVPVPLSKERLLERGFNQSHMLARHLARSISLPLHDRLLIRTKDIRPQSMLDRERRKTNPRGAFSLDSKPSRAVPRSVLLVDDVMTTGATMNECARVLKKGGAETVYAVVLARTRSD